jgi:hypothetical protein
MKVEEAGLRIRPWGLKTKVKDLDRASDDVVFMIRRAAYVEEIREVALRARRMAWAALFMGAVTVLWAVLRGPGVHSRAAHTGEAAILLAWGLFFYVMFQRTRYVRRHPFDPALQHIHTQH